MIFKYIINDFIPITLIIVLRYTSYFIRELNIMKQIALNNGYKVYIFSTDIYSNKQIMSIFKTLIET